MQSSALLCCLDGPQEPHHPERDRGDGDEHGDHQMEHRQVRREGQHPREYRPVLGGERVRCRSDLEPLERGRYELCQQGEDEPMHPDPAIWVDARRDDTADEQQRCQDQGPIHV